MAKRGRETELDINPLFKNLRQTCVNPFEIMMAKAKAAAGKACIAPQQQQAQAGPSAFACSHCGKPEADCSRVRQCAGCSDVFCTLCSIATYDTADDRYFCLECHGHEQGRTAAAAPAPFSGACGAQSHAFAVDAGAGFGCATPAPHSVLRSVQSVGGGFPGSAGAHVYLSPAYSHPPFVSPAIPINWDN